MPPDPSQWIGSALPAGRDLSAPELRSLASSLGSERRLWQPLVRHRVEARYFLQLHRDPHVDVWLICWTNQQDTGFHDHDVSSGAVHVCTGELVEDRFELTRRGLRTVACRRLEGETFFFDASRVHRVRHPRGRAPAVSIHVYSPALWRMGYYDADPGGPLRRVSITYADEMEAA